jgi:hypothetical protein
MRTNVENDTGGQVVARASTSSANQMLRGLQDAVLRPIAADATLAVCMRDHGRRAPPPRQHSFHYARTQTARSGAYRFVCRVTKRCRLSVTCAVSRGAWVVAKSAQQAHTPVVGKLHTLGNDRHADRHAQCGPRRTPRAARGPLRGVGTPLRRLAIELTDLDRQLDKIVHTERWRAVLWGMKSRGVGDE